MIELTQAQAKSFIHALDCEPLQSIANCLSNHLGYELVPHVWAWEPEHILYKDGDNELIDPFCDLLLSLALALREIPTKLG